MNSAQALSHNRITAGYRPLYLWAKGPRNYLWAWITTATRPGEHRWLLIRRNAGRLDADHS